MWKGWIIQMYQHGDMHVLSHTESVYIFTCISFADCAKHWNMLGQLSRQAL